MNHRFFQICLIFLSALAVQFAAGEALAEPTAEASEAASEAPEEVAGDIEPFDAAAFVERIPIAFRPLDVVGPRGLGVHFIKSTMDRVEYRENEHGGTTLSMLVHAPEEKDPS